LDLSSERQGRFGSSEGLIFIEMVKKWETQGEDAAEIFCLEAEVLKGTRDEAWDTYIKLKEHWIDTLYKRKNLNANFGKTYKRYHEYKATLRGLYSY
jgi:hypothetical protein